MARVGNSTIGMKVFYAVEQTAGTRPTTASAYTQIPGIKDIPGIGEEVSAIDVTPLEELEFEQFVAGLKTTGGNIAFVANNTNAFQTAWAALVSAYQAAIPDDKNTWFCITHPNLENAFYFTGEPVHLGLSAASVNEALNANANVVAGKVEGWAAKPTA